MKALFDVLLAPGEPDLRARLRDRSRSPARAHIAIIMDGNGRWAKRRNLPRVAGHKAGIDPVRVTVETCARLGLRALTLYAFSVENWKRPRAEVDMLWRLLRLSPARGAARYGPQRYSLRSHRTHRPSTGFRARGARGDRACHRRQSRLAAQPGDQLWRARGGGRRR